MESTLLEAIRSQSNDYSSEERRFLARTGLNLIALGDLPDNSTSFEVHDKQDTSVIISAYQGHQTIPVMLRRLSQQSIKNFEVIIVDDGSPNTMLPIVEAEEPTFPVKYVREVDNRGRSFTRNTGMLMSDGDNLIFTDQDIAFDPQFVERFAIKQGNTSDAVYLGFKEDVDLENLDPYKKANYQTDWRYAIDAQSGFFMLGTPPEEKTIPARTYKILEETDNLKSFGYGRTIGFWDLASTVISHGMSVGRDAAIKSGGFPEKGFDGWGAQDIAFGARLIGQGNYVVPSLDTAYFHINHPRYSGSREKEMEELKKNMVGYNNLLKTVNFSEKPEDRLPRKIKTIGMIEYYEV